MADHQTGVKPRGTQSDNSGISPEPQPAATRGAVPAANSPDGVVQGTRAGALLKGGQEPSFVQTPPETDHGRRS